MRARAIAGGLLSSAAIVVIGWQIGAAPETATTAPAPAAGTSSGASAATPGTSSGSPSSSTSPSAAPSSSASSAAKSGTFDGVTSQTQYGPVQVEIIVTAGKITDVKALQLTDQGGRSVQISNYAAPILRTEAISAQSAKIQAVSGATYTSEGYTSSLQSAIDKAGL